MGMFENLIKGNLPHYTRKIRHIRQLLRHSTPRKLANLAKAEWSLSRGHVVLQSKPYIYIIDPCNACDLRCPLCPTGARTLNRSTRMMSLECFQGLIDQVKPYAVEIILYSWGEPFLHPQIFDMVRYAQKNNIGTNISSHFNHITDEMIDRIIDSGLENISISLDGVSQEVYQVYRVNGKVDDVISGIRRLQLRKKERKSRTPNVEWQFIVMKHNEHEIPQAEKLARDLEVEQFRLLGVGLPFEELTNQTLAEQWISDTPEYRGYHPEKILQRGYLYDESCFYPFRTLVINPDGGVAPCCAISHEQWDFGDVHKESLWDIWNNRKYQSARSLFSRHPVAERVPTVCDGCLLYNQKSPFPRSENSTDSSQSSRVQDPVLG